MQSRLNNRFNQQVNKYVFQYDAYRPPVVRPPPGGWGPSILVGGCIHPGHPQMHSARCSPMDAPPGCTPRCTTWMHTQSGCTPFKHYFPATSFADGNNKKAVQKDTNPSLRWPSLDVSTGAVLSEAEQNDRQTHVKTLPFRNYCCGSCLGD